MTQNPQINAAGEVLFVTQQLHTSFHGSESTLAVSDSWEPNRLTFDVLLEGERIAKLFLPAAEVLRYRGFGQIDVNQFVYLT